MNSDSFKAGFVTILGKPNVGKSTLMNALIGERLSIISSKAQTTRHRIFGIITDKDFQIVYSDTPGLIDPSYKLQENMMNFVTSSLEDADIVLHIVELGEKKQESEILDRLHANKKPLILVINKIDLAKGSQLKDKIDYWREFYPDTEIIPISAKDKLNLPELLNAIVDKLPVHPPFFPAESLTDKSERFITAEIIREKIFLNYTKEVPYSTEVEIEEFKESDKIIRIRALIYVERDSQKGIIIGKKGESLKKVGIESRTELEKFFNKQVHLETFVKVEKNWRKNDKSLRKFGYQNS